MDTIHLVNYWFRYDKRFAQYEILTYSSRAVRITVKCTFQDCPTLISCLQCIWAPRSVTTQNSTKPGQLRPRWYISTVQLRRGQLRSKTLPYHLQTHRVVRLSNPCKELKFHGWNCNADGCFQCLYTLATNQLSLSHRSVSFMLS